MLLLMRSLIILVFCCTLLIYGPSLAQDGPSGDGTIRQIRVPILMYHYVSPLPADADALRYDLTVEPPVFAAHMQYLADQGYAIISLDAVYDALMYGTPLPAKPLVLTFDDGYRDHYDYVFPILQQHGFTATFFVITGRADNADPAHLSWEQIDEMARAGMHMEVHTKSHVSLEGRDRDFLIYELLGSRESLKAHTGVDALMLAYPAGRYDALTLEVADELGFHLAVTTQPGATQDSSRRLELSRLRVSHDTGVSGLAYLLRSS